ncbi:hypothetical protein [Paenibacillus protaetiae]|uniref:Uncharacterized protein n=1 Tax=Paenibacillus protaetiae TaxID=2509456 RepID=A0A4P6EZ86_9BACL|nr:hypothetical protein [Paenibacillus protaetiae]QAY68085.1 hypothetical protein ET464_18645 [Paenibacillus protaetiae]
MAQSRASKVWMNKVFKQASRHGKGKQPANKTPKTAAPALPVPYYIPPAPYKSSEKQTPGPAGGRHASTGKAASPARGGARRLSAGKIAVPGGFLQPAADAAAPAGEVPRGLSAGRRTAAAAPTASGGNTLPHGPAGALSAGRRTAAAAPTASGGNTLPHGSAGALSAGRRTAAAAPTASGGNTLPHGPAGALSAGRRTASGGSPLSAGGRSFGMAAEKNAVTLSTGTIPRIGNTARFARVVVYNRRPAAIKATVTVIAWSSPGHSRIIQTDNINIPAKHYEYYTADIDEITDDYELRITISERDNVKVYVYNLNEGLDPLDELTIKDSELSTFKY